MCARCSKDAYQAAYQVFRSASFCYKEAMSGEARWGLKTGICYIDNYSLSLSYTWN